MSVTIPETCPETGRASSEEPAIWSSVIILGVFVALPVKAPVWVGAVIAGLFGQVASVYGPNRISGTPS
jgi:HupE / UreJ protein